MRISYTPHFTRSYSKAPQDIRRAFDKQAALLLQNLRHPSLPAKKYDDAQDLWQARVSGAWRFYFLIEGDVYLMTEIRAHPK
jgi:mRNA-degrading endonuclease RelE of RelBE toxin-antitoxin system